MFGIDWVQPALDLGRAGCGDTLKRTNPQLKQYKTLPRGAILGSQRAPSTKRQPPCGGASWRFENIGRRARGDNPPIRHEGHLVGDVGNLIGSMDRHQDRDRPAFPHLVHQQDHVAA